MEDGDATLPDGQQAVDLSHDNHALREEIAFDFLHKRSRNLSSPKDDSCDLMVSDLTSLQNDDVVYLGPEAAKQSDSDAVSNRRVSSDEKGPCLVPVASMGVTSQSLAADPEMSAPQTQETDIMQHRQRLLVALPFMPSDVRDQYKEVRSNTVGRVLDLAASPEVGELLTVVLTDGTQSKVCYTAFWRVLFFFLF